MLWSLTPFTCQLRELNNMFGMLSLIEWQRTLEALKKTHVVAYDDVFEDFGKVWCVKGLIATRSNLVMSWKIRLRIGTNYHMMLCGSLAGFPPWWFVYGYLFAVDSFQFVPKNTKNKACSTKLFGMMFSRTRDVHQFVLFKFGLLFGVTRCNNF